MDLQRAGMEARPYAYVRKTSPRQWRAGVEADPTHFDVTPSRGDTKQQCGIFRAFGLAGMAVFILR
jgi:hypothetical protein